MRFEGPYIAQMILGVRTNKLSSVNVQFFFRKVEYLLLTVMVVLGWTEQVLRRQCNREGQCHPTYHQNRQTTARYDGRGILEGQHDVCLHNEV